MTHRRIAALAAAAAVSASTVLTAVTVTDATAADVVVPDRHTVVCATATFYPQYDSAQGPYGTPRTLVNGDGIGHTRGAHPVYNGWAAVQDFGPNDWGFIRVECIS